MKQNDLTPDDFDNLLNWLHADRDQAGKKYEDIRRGLIEIFNYKGCAEAEDLADATINRVARRVKEIRDDYQGQPERYFYGVAKKVHLEYLKQHPTVELPASLESPQQEDVEKQYNCLEQCLKKLTNSNRTLILQYYRERKQAKIESRRALRQMLNLKSSALRVRVFRIRETLEKCVRSCLELEDET